MKRTLVLIVAALLIFGGAYFALALLLPNPDISLSERTTNLPSIPEQSEGIIGPTKNVTLRSHDPETGRPIAEVNIGQYRRTSESEVELGQVRANIALEGGGVIELTSPVGRVTLEAAADTESLSVESFGTADIGTLSDVTIRYFDAPAALAADKPTLTTTVPMIAFDRTRLTMQTIDTEIEGRTVFGENVPVTVRGQSFDFDGSGLVVRWDESRNRPRLVRFPGGGRLTIKDPELLMPAKTESAMTPTGRGMLASLGTAALVQAAEETPEVVSYLLRLSDNLDVRQAGDALLAADWAEAVLPVASGDNELSLAPSEPAPEPKPKTESADKPPVTPAGKPAEAKPEPIVVTWTGPAELQPLEQARPTEPPLSSTEELRFRMGGAPLTLAREGMVARGGVLSYDRALDELRLLPGSTEDGGDKGERVLRRINALGDVDVQHPRMNLAAGELELQLSPPVEGEQHLTSAEARTDVFLQIIKEGLTASSFIADRLNLSMPTGPEGEIAATADGDVELLHEGIRLQTDKLTSTLAKAPEDPKAERELLALSADKNVTVIDVLGQTVEADRAEIASPGEPLRLLGAPGELATVRVIRDDEPDADQASAVLAAPEIVLDRDSKQLVVPKAGLLEAIVLDDQKRELRRTASWAGSLVATEQRVDLEEAVTLSADLEPGLTLTLRGQSASMELNPKSPEAENAGAGAPADAPADEPADEEAGEVSLDPSDVRQFLVDGGISLDVERREARQIVQGINLRGEQLVARPGDGTLTVPSAGKMLLRDLRPEDAEGGFRGSVAVEWEDGLQYTGGDDDPMQGGSLEIAGRSFAAIEPVGSKRIEIESDTFTAIFAAGEASKSLDLVAAAATGNVTFVTPTGQKFLASEFTFEPGRERLIAVGDENNPIRYFDAAGVRQGELRQVIYSTATGQVEITALRVGG